MSVIDTTRNTVATTISVGQQPGPVTLGPDGRHAYVPNGRSNSVTVIHTGNNTITATIPVQQNPRPVTPEPGRALRLRGRRRLAPISRVALSPDGARAHIVSHGSSGGDRRLRVTRSQIAERSAGRRASSAPIDRSHDLKTAPRADCCSPTGRAPLLQRPVRGHHPDTRSTDLHRNHHRYRRAQRGNLAGRAVFILVWVGFMALFRGVSDIGLAFALRRLG